MLSQEVEEKLANYLVRRIEQTNNYILKKIGETIKQISTLTPSQAYQLGQILKYGGVYDEIAKELARVSGKNVEDIYKIFDEIAKDNKQFAKQFYKYRNINYIPYNKDLALQSMVRSIGDVTAGTYMNIARTKGVGFLFKDVNGKTYFKNIQEAYYEIIDRGILSISQGKETFDAEMRKIIKQLGNSGLVMYKSGRTRRLDSAIRMNLLDGIRQVNNETTKRFGKEYDADGIEISAHSNPAPDHADIQGRQFSNEEYEKLENGEIAKDYKGNTYDGADKRHISEYNCYHRISNIVLGVSKPMYTDEQLNEIQETNLKGFEYKGKHYTMYEGTQLQRQIETAVRKQKDTQILARSAGDNELVQQSQLKITQLTHKYNELCNVSGLAPVKQRMSVSGYSKIGTREKSVIEQPRTFNEINDSLKAKNITITDGIINLEDKALRDKNLLQLDKLSDKYNHDRFTKVDLRIGTYTDKYGGAGISYYSTHEIKLNTDLYDNRNRLLQYEEVNQNGSWHYKVDEKDRDIYSITHEYGHIVEYEYFKKELLKKNILPAAATKKQRMLIDSQLRTTLMERAIARLDKKITKTEFKNIYFSRYAKMKNNFEWFAEGFVKAELTNDNDVWAQVLREWLKENAQR